MNSGPMTSKPPDRESLGEFELIARYLAPLATDPGARGLNDDVAVLNLARTGGDLVLNADAIVAGVHFLADEDPAAIAERVLRVNLSDLAAKGAAPLGYLLTLALSTGQDEAWIAAFAAGLRRNQDTFGWSLLGGDTVRTPGPLTINVTAIGNAAAAAPRRGGAQSGDQVWVSGTIGDAVLGLAFCQGRGPDLTAALAGHVTVRFRQPEPRVELGSALIGSGLVTASADISDGLIADLGHIAEASSLRAVIDGAAIPLSPSGVMAVDANPQWFEQMITGGDDYELLLTAPASASPELSRLAAQNSMDLTMIGHMEEGRGVTVTGRGGQPLCIAQGGYRHF